MTNTGQGGPGGWCHVAALCVTWMTPTSTRASPGSHGSHPAPKKTTEQEKKKKGRQPACAPSHAHANTVKAFLRDAIPCTHITSIHYSLLRRFAMGHGHGPRHDVIVFTGLQIHRKAEVRGP